jgi:hypothetical protein
MKPPAGGIRRAPELVRFANQRTSSRYETTPIAASIERISRPLRADVGRALALNRVTADRLQTAELAVEDRLTVAGALYLLDDPASVLGKTIRRSAALPRRQHERLRPTR